MRLEQYPEDRLKRTLLEILGNGTSRRKGRLPRMPTAGESAPGPRGTGEACGGAPLETTSPAGLRNERSQIPKARLPGPGHGEGRQMTAVHGSRFIVRGTEVPMNHEP